MSGRLRELAKPKDRAAGSSDPSGPEIHTSHEQPLTLDGFYFSRPLPGQIPDSTHKRAEKGHSRAANQIKSLKALSRASHSLAQKDHFQLELDDLELYQKLISKLVGIECKIVRNSEPNQDRFFNPLANTSKEQTEPILVAIHKSRGGKETLYVRESLLGSDDSSFSYKILSRHISSAMSQRACERWGGNIAAQFCFAKFKLFAWPLIKRFGWPLEQHPKLFVQGIISKYWYSPRYRARLRSTAMVPHASKERIIKDLIDNYFSTSFVGKRESKGFSSALVDLAYDLGTRATSRRNASGALYLAGRFRSMLETFAPPLAERIFFRDRKALTWSGVKRTVFASRVASELAASGASPALVCAALLHQLPKAERTEALRALKEDRLPTESGSQPPAQQSSKSSKRRALFAELVEAHITAMEDLVVAYPTSPAEITPISEHAQKDRVHLDDSARNKSARYIQLVNLIPRKIHAQREEKARADQTDAETLKELHRQRITPGDLLRFHQAILQQSVTLVTNKASGAYLENLQRGVTRIFAPLAERFQQLAVNRELRNALFRAIYPEEYAMVVRALRGPDGVDMSYADSEKLTQNLAYHVGAYFQQYGLTQKKRGDNKGDFEIFSRPKDPESLWRKWKERAPETDFSEWLRKENDLLGLMIVLNDELLERKFKLEKADGTSQEVDGYTLFNLKIKDALASALRLSPRADGNAALRVEGEKSRHNWFYGVESAAWFPLRIENPSNREGARAFLPLEVQIHLHRYYEEAHKRGASGKRTKPHHEMKVTRVIIYDARRTFGHSDSDIKKYPEILWDRDKALQEGGLNSRFKIVADGYKDVVNIEFYTDTLSRDTNSLQRFEKQQYFRTYRYRAGATALDHVLSPAVNKDPEEVSVWELELKISSKDGFTRQIHEWREVAWDEKLQIDKVYALRYKTHSTAEKPFNPVIAAHLEDRSKLLLKRSRQTALNQPSLFADFVDLNSFLSKDNLGNYNQNEVQEMINRGLVSYMREFENLDYRAELRDLEESLAQGSTDVRDVRFDQRLLDRLVFHFKFLDAYELFEAIGRGIVTTDQLRERHDQDYVIFNASHTLVERGRSDGSKTYNDLVRVEGDELQMGILVASMGEAVRCGLRVVSARSKDDIRHGRQFLELELKAIGPDSLSAAAYAACVPNIRRERGMHQPENMGIQSDLMLECLADSEQVVEICSIFSEAGFDIPEMELGLEYDQDSLPTHSLMLHLSGPCSQFDPDSKKKMAEAWGKVLEQLKSRKKIDSANQLPQVKLLRLETTNYELGPEITNTLPDNWEISAKNVAT